MKENNNYNQEMVPVNSREELAIRQNNEIQGNKLVIIDQEKIQTNVRLVNQNGQSQQKLEITYEKNTLVAFFAGGKSLSKDNKEKAKPNQYNTVNVDDLELFDGKIKCARLKCIAFGIITAILNTIRLGYL